MLHNIQFHGLPSENLNAHVTSFIEVCDTVNYNGVTEEALKLSIFPLSVSDQAKHWLTSQPPDSITSSNDLVQVHTWMQVHTFYNGLGDSARTIIDALVGGALMKKTINQTYEILEDTTTNTNQWPRDR